jgi:hypothetical protein
MLFETQPDVIFGANVTIGRVTVGDIIHMIDNTGIRYVLGPVVDIFTSKQQQVNQIDNTNQGFAIKITNGALVKLKDTMTLYGRTPNNQQ